MKNKFFTCYEQMEVANAAKTPKIHHSKPNTVSIPAVRHSPRMADWLVFRNADKTADARTLFRSSSGGLRARQFHSVRHHDFPLHRARPTDKQPQLYGISRSGQAKHRAETAVRNLGRNALHDL